MIIQNKRELGTVLAALRYYQRHQALALRSPGIDEIASSDGTDPLSASEIDALCESLNAPTANLPPATEFRFVLKDKDGTGGQLVGSVGTGKDHQLYLQFDGYGEQTAVTNPSGIGVGSPVMVELYKGDLRVIIWGDVNQEDPTAICSLAGASEKLRREP